MTDPKKQSLTCGKCHGAGWLFPWEAGDHTTDQRYTCDQCGGTGWEQFDIEPYPWSEERSEARDLVREYLANNQQ